MEIFQKYPALKWLLLWGGAIVLVVVAIHFFARKPTTTTPPSGTQDDKQYGIAPTSAFNQTIVLNNPGTGGTPVPPGPVPPTSSNPGPVDLPTPVSTPTAFPSPAPAARVDPPTPIGGPYSASGQTGMFSTHPATTHQLTPRLETQPGSRSEQRPSLPRQTPPEYRPALSRRSPPPEYRPALPRRGPSPERRPSLPAWHPVQVYNNFRRHAR